MQNFNKHTKEDVIQKLLDTVHDKLDTELTMEDIDWAAVTLNRIKDYEMKDKDLIVNGKDF